MISVKNKNISVSKFVKFCIVGGTGAIITWGLTWILTDKFGLWYMWSLIVSTAIAMSSNYILNSTWTFSSTIKTPKARKADYDWNSYWKGNVIQKWWKHSIATKTIQMINPEKILDVGCGSSPLLSLVKCSKKYGVDTNLDKIQFISKEDDSSRYVWYNGDRLPFGRYMFDTIVCNEVIEHHPRPSDLINSIVSVMEKDGVLIISTPDFSTMRWNIIQKLSKVFMRSGYEDDHGSKFTKTGLVSLCNAYGLELVKMNTVFGCDMICKFKKIN